MIFTFLMIAATLVAQEKQTPNRLDEESKSAISILTGLTDDVDPQIRYAAFLSILESKCDVAIKEKIVLKMMGDDYQSSATVAHKASEKLFRNEPERVVNRILQLLYSENMSTRRIALNLLKKYPKIAAPKVNSLLASDMYGDKKKLELLSVVKVWASEGSVCLPSLIKLLKNDRLSNKAIGSIGEQAKPALADLGKIANDSNSKLRVRAISAMGQIIVDENSQVISNSRKASSNTRRRATYTEAQSNSIEDRLLRDLDKNRDGKISGNEYDTRYKMFDTDGDKVITKSEIRTYFEKMQRR